MREVLAYFFVIGNSQWAIQRGYRWKEKQTWMLVWHRLDSKGDADFCNNFGTPEEAIQAILDQKTGVELWDKFPSDKIPEKIAHLEHWRRVPGNVEM